MKYRVLLSDEAIDGVRRYLHYLAIEQAAPHAATQWWDKALAKIDSLDEMPQRCPFAPENQFEEITIRMLIVDRCLFLFTIDEPSRAVHILKFRHGRQEPIPLDRSEV